MAKSYAIIENAGYEGENDTGGRWNSMREALAYVRKMYDADEIEDMHVEVAMVLDDGSFSYDY